MRIEIQTSKPNSSISDCVVYLNNLVGAHDFFQPEPRESKVTFRSYANTSYQLLIGIISVWQTLTRNGYTANYGDNSYIKIDNIVEFYKFITSIKTLADIKLVL